MMNFQTLLKKIFIHWPSIQKQRNDLRDMSDWILKDIGISRDEAEKQAKMPFWRSTICKSTNNIAPECDKYASIFCSKSKRVGLK